MSFSFRNWTPSDSRRCMQLLERRLPVSPPDRAVIHRVWCEAAALHLPTAVVEDARRPVETRVIGFGVGLFVTDGFADEARQTPPLSHLDLLLNRYVHGPRPILDRAGLAHANTAGALTAYQIFIGYASDELEPESDFRARETMMRSYVASHRGFRLREILQVVPSDDVIEMVINGGFSLRLTERWSKCGSTGYLVGATRDEILKRPGTPLTSLFTAPEPRCWFRAREQQILRLGLQGDTDEQMARTLSMSVPNVKKQWSAIYARIAALDPPLFPGAGELPGDRKRGAEKRRHLLNYLTEHPEELRPLAPPETRS